MSCEALFLKQLRQRGYRLTPQREKVLVALHHIGHPATADEIYSLVAADNNNAHFEISTVYRTLELLHDINMVTMIDMGEKQRLYLLAVQESPHLHLVCRGCGKIIAVDAAELQPLVSQLSAAYHFAADLSDLTLPGLCVGCENAQAAQPAVG